MMWMGLVLIHNKKKWVLEILSSTEEFIRVAASAVFFYYYYMTGVYA